MKLQLAQMQKAKLVQESNAQESTTSAVDSRLLYVGGLVVLGRLVFLAYKHLNEKKLPPEIQMSPVNTRPRTTTPPPPQNLKMN